MRLGQAITVVFLLATVAAAGPTRTARPASDRVSSARLARVVPGATLPVVKVYRYRMAGKIRPLFFWIGRDEVGAGEIVWRRGEEGTVAYELLIGTDPAMAPKALNRWGYIAEEIRGSDGELLALISKSDEGSVGEVREGLNDGVPRHAFSAIRASISAGTSHASLWTIRTAADLTFRDVDTLLEAAEEEPNEAEQHVETVPGGVHPGFLAAVAELIRTSVRAHHASPGAAAAMKGSSVAYVYGDSIHDLTLRSHDRRTRSIDGRQYRLVHGKFETRKRLNGKKTRFEVSYGTEGRLTEVPISIKYQPRWWLQVELLLNSTGHSQPVVKVPLHSYGHSQRPGGCG